VNTWRVGTSGWQYADWKGPVYDPRLPQTRWLESYADRFDCVELNNSFYRLPTFDRFAMWAQTVPPGFVFAVKASRYLTHIRRLQEPAEPVSRLLEHARGLGAALGPVLLQLPPTLQVDLRRLEETLDCFGGEVPVAVEPRHPTWWIPAVQRILERHGAALVWADHNGRLMNPPWVTADWAFVRLHHGPSRWEYGTLALRNRAARWQSAFRGGWVFCNNDPGAAAVRDAQRLSLQLADRWAADCSSVVPAVRR